MTDEQASTAAINAHYTTGDLGERILAGLRAAGKDAETINPDDLAPVDQFHIGGREATRALAHRAGLTSGLSVLDVGGGLGGPARTLAREFGCRVTVLDLTDAYCRVGEMLTARAGMAGQVTFRQGNALTIPFADRSFDVVWTQHSSMNIADKAGLYREVRRVLRPDGRLVLHEAMAGPASPIRFPVPWARDPSVSFLQQPEEVRSLLIEAGFHTLAWVDTSREALAWFTRRRSAVAPASVPPLGLHLLLGADVGAMIRNLVRNLAEDRLVVIEGVLARD